MTTINQKLNLKAQNFDKSSGRKGGKATSMADLMAKQTTNLVTFHKSDNIQGIITKLTSNEILVDIGSKTEAVVLEKDRNILKSLLRFLKVGDKVTVSILNPESDMGNPVVSLRRFIEERLWEGLEEKRNEKTVFEAKIDESTRGGFMVTTSEGLSGFLPNSQISLMSGADSMVGKSIKVSIHELNRSLHKVVFSQKATVVIKDFENATSGLKRGDSISATVSNVAPFGVFVLIKNGQNNVEGFIHSSEVSWESVQGDLPQMFKQGASITAQITGFDNESRRVNLSIKRLTADPFEDKVKGYKVDQKIKGSIKKISSIGIIVDLGDNVEGIIKKDKVPPNIDYKTGDELDATISEVDLKRHRVILAPVLMEKPIGYR